MRLPVVLAVVGAMLGSGAATAGGAEPVAVIVGEEVSRAEFAGPGGAPVELQRLHDYVWRRATRRYVEENGLQATNEEIAELAAYHREFERKDRAQRARKLEELNQRLAAGGIDDRQREWLEEFRAVLTRLAQDDLALEGSSGPDAEERAAMFGPVIEVWKTNVSLYHRYGGVVALTRFGPDPQEARRALLEAYERRGLIRFHDAALRERLFARLAARPPIVVAPGDVDFTPYWRRPIPPSYFPDEVPRQEDSRE